MCVEEQSREVAAVVVCRCVIVAVVVCYMCCVMCVIVV